MSDYNYTHEMDDTSGGGGRHGPGAAFAGGGGACLLFWGRAAGYAGSARLADDA